MELFKASHQWSTRPVDERFSSLQDLHRAVTGYRADARESTRPYTDLRIAADGSDILVNGKANVPARFTHWAFGQLCARVQAPASYLRALPPALSESDERGRIQSARRFSLGQNKDAVLDAIFKLRVAALSRQRIAEGYTLAVEHETTDGDPRTAWGMANGLTRLSQTLPYADERVSLDRAAGKVLEMAF